MNRNVKICISIIVAGSLCFACDAGFDLPKSRGKIVEQSIDVDPFNYITAIDEVDIYLSWGMDQKVLIRAGENLISKIKLTVKDSVLYIRNNNSFNWVRSPGNPEIYITMNTLQGIEVFDFINIYTIDTLYATDLFIYTRSTGDISLLLNSESVSITSDYIEIIELEGKADDFYVNCIRDARILASGLIVKNIKVEHSGSNRMEVFPLKKLSGIVNGTGDLIYFNDPEEIDLSIQNSGRAYHVQ